MSLASWIAALFGRKPAPATSPEPKLMIETPPVMVDAPAVDDPVTTLADTLWMEARGDGKDGMQAVANVICNRANNPRWWGSSIAGVCLKPYQFSSWNPGSTQLPLVKEARGNGDASYAIALNLATLAVQGILPDMTKGSDSYYATSLKTPPTWATPAAFRCEVGAQRFYGVELPLIV